MKQVKKKKEFRIQKTVSRIKNDKKIEYSFMSFSNLLDELDAFFFGKKQIFLLRKAEA